MVGVGEAGVGWTKVLGTGFASVRGASKREDVGGKGAV
jgi:hypothetical protein